MEEWKCLENYNYLVSNYGNVKRVNGNALKIQKNNYVPICKNGKVKLFKVSRLVAELFLENNLNNKIVNHIDGNKLNNNVNNLEWVSRKDISIHSLKNKNKHLKRKLDDDGIEWIKNSNENIYKIAKIFEIKPIDVKRIKKLSK